MLQQELVRTQVLIQQRETFRKMKSSKNKYRSFLVSGLKTIPFLVISHTEMSRSGYVRVAHSAMRNLNSSHHITLLRNARFICLGSANLLQDINCYRQKLWCLKSQHYCPDSFPRKHFFCSLSWNIFPGNICKPKMTGYSISMWRGNWTQFRRKLSLPIMT